MTKQHELMVTAGSLQECSAYMDAGASELLIGDARFGLRLPGHFSEKDIREAVRMGQARSVKVILSLTNIMTNEMLRMLPDYILFLRDAGVNAVEYCDPSVLAAVKTYAPSIKLHWNAEMMSTNYATANYWGRKGASRIAAAKELSMDEILELKAHLEIESQIQVHGMTNIYHSKRRMVESYMVHQGRPVKGGNLGRERGLFLVEADRAQEKYPIFEDENGTHIMSSDDICILEDLHVLMKAGIDSFKIDGFMKSPTYNAVVINAYRTAMDAYEADPASYRFREEWLDPIRELQDPERELTFGFFYKEQVY
ncbi:U32 family peptidase [Paenibacillus sp. HJL G12]|uniref:U32 family peptidase n=1 Tax=Paenibacillus dendrobii TaxID=2691084 RepID=A0A7X3IMN1_9BACL|nr:peptidase U32 family protein [Paenibacillus dendrobii]MWV45450.1 U32 family peptidase [Paenibacillus dendrobii]